MPHLTIKELEAQLETARQAEREQEQEYNRKMQELKTTFLTTSPYTYTARIEVFSNKSFRYHVPIQGKLRLSRKIMHKTMQDYCKEHNTPFIDLQAALYSISGSDGMSYYLTTDGIIHHTGRGTILLKTPQLCTKTEWEQIKTGDIPEKFIKEA